MGQSEEKFVSILQQLNKGVAPQRETVRSLLLWFGAERRGFRVIRRIRSQLRKHQLITSPDFEWAYIDSHISFKKAPPEAKGDQGIPDDSSPDPTYRISHLKSANTRPISVTPDATIQQVVTIMMSNDFSQVPVIIGQREVKGVVSWKTIGTRMALKRQFTYARDCMEEAKILPEIESLFSAIATISSHDYVLVQKPDKTICGIVTASDLNEQFQLLAEPFLLVGEIENGIRRLLHGKFTQLELDACKAPGDNGRVIEIPADLSFGEYIRLIEKEESWKKFHIEIDRATFVAQLNKIKDIRNDVMHFDPDGLEEDDLKLLRQFASFLKRLRDVGAV